MPAPLAAVSPRVPSDPAANTRRHLGTPHLVRPKPDSAARSVRLLPARPPGTLCGRTTQVKTQTPHSDKRGKRGPTPSCACSARTGMSGTSVRTTFSPGLTYPLPSRGRPRRGSPQRANHDDDDAGERLWIHSIRGRSRLVSVISVTKMPGIFGAPPQRMAGSGFYAADAGVPLHHVSRVPWAASLIVCVLGISGGCAITCASLNFHAQYSTFETNYRCRFVAPLPLPPPPFARARIRFDGKVVSWHGQGSQKSLGRSLNAMVPRANEDAAKRKLVTARRGRYPEDLGTGSNITSSKPILSSPALWPSLLLTQPFAFSQACRHCLHGSPLHGTVQFLAHHEPNQSRHGLRNFFLARITYIRHAPLLSPLTDEDHLGSSHLPGTSSILR